MGPGARTRLRRWLILSHRYLGIGIGFLVVIWFVSGIGMIYAGGMPELTEEEALRGMETLDPDLVALTPAEAARTAGGRARRDGSDALDAGGTEVGVRGSVILEALGERPVYRFLDPSGGAPRTVFADTGELLEAVDEGTARDVAARFLDVPGARLRHEGLLRRADQWTISLRDRLPLHKHVVDGGRRGGTEIYVAARSGEVVQLTTRGERMLAWVAAIPHWLYWTPLRVRDGLWRQVVLWTSGIGCVLVALGLVLAVVQLRSSRPTSGAGRRSRIPYRGWLRWHYVTGAVFGVFALTWVFSGLLSMEPAGWAAGEGLEIDRLREALSGGPLDPSSFPPPEPGAWEGLLPGRTIKQVEYARILGTPHYVVRSVDASSVDAPGASASTLVVADPLAVRRAPVPVDTLVDLVRGTYPEAPVVDAELLGEYDAYHYDREGRAALPVLRVRLDDPSGTWLYIDPATATLSRSVHRLDRIERWIYHGFHSLDFAFWYDRRPLWDVGVLLLLLGGLATSGIGVYLGAGRLVRNLGR